MRAADDSAATGPRAICILRLSAIGDTCHAVPLICALRRRWPAARITWIIGRTESKLISLLPGVELLSVDKRRFGAELVRLRRELASRRFDLLLHLHASFRANLLSLLVRAPVRIGFDRARARDLQWLFTNRKIAARRREHVLDSFWGFAQAVGIEERPLEWDFALPAASLEYARQIIPEGRATLLVSPCSSHALRNWRPEYYAAVCDEAHRRFGLEVVLCGGPSALEREMGEHIMARVHTPVRNQIGRDTLPQMLALLARATALITPDSGPAHMATATGTPVIGLYAATNPDRSGPYLSRRWCVDRYPEAARRFRGRAPEELPWWTKIERPGVMDLIQPGDVLERLGALLRERNAPAEELAAGAQGASS